jgi:6-phosphogluconate dehydrogenase
MTEGKADFGVLGLGVMGANLALNMADRGFEVAIYNRTRDRTDLVTDQLATPGQRLAPTFTLEELVERLERPRRLLLMVKAGAPVDTTLHALEPLLEPGDVVIDGGNELYPNTERRLQRAAIRGVHYLGMGVSGGEEGARHGPSLMPGGPREAYALVEPVLRKIAAQVEDGPCVTYIGPGGAGHFVKMVHNGIEYGDMQLIAEAYDILARLGGLDADALADTFEAWNQGELESFLIEITARVFRKQDELTGGRLVDQILDTAQMKGTGSWTVSEAAALGAPIPTIAAAVDARLMSARHALRQEGAARLGGSAPAVGVDPAGLVADVKAALYAAKACSYAQGLGILAQASAEKGWGLDLAEICRIWKGGCIIRARFLGELQEVFRADPGLPNLLFAPTFVEALGARQAAWRRVVGQAVAAGIPVPGLSASLAYYDALRRARLPANLIQAQRDLFGAHTFQRLDREGTFHAEWGE